MLKIYVNPDDVWDYFQKYKARLEKHIDAIAEIEEGGVETGLKVFVTEEVGYPLLSIESGDVVIEKEIAISKKECKAIAEKFYKMIEELAEQNDDAASHYEVNETDIQLVSERENELCLALKKFLLILVGLSEDDQLEFYDGELSDIMDGVESLLFEQYGYLVYRPRIAETDGGNTKLINSLYEEEYF